MKDIFFYGKDLDKPFGHRIQLKQTGRDSDMEAYIYRRRD